VRVAPACVVFETKLGRGRYRGRADGKRVMCLSAGRLSYSTEGEAHNETVENVQLGAKKEKLEHWSLFFSLLSFGPPGSA
jgi:hypothetical protein